MQVPHLMRIGLPVLFLFGPLFYFYVKVLTDRTVRLRSRDLVHGIPFLVFVALMLPFYFSSREEKIIEIGRIKTFAAEPVFLLVATIQVIHIFAYMIPVRIILKQYNEKIRNTKSSLERINLRWLRTGTTLYLAVFGFMQLLTTLQAFGIPTVDLYHTSIPLIVTAIIYGLGYMGLRQPEIFSPAEEMAAGKKYEKSALTPELAREYSSKVKEYVEAEKPYLESELTLPCWRIELAYPHISSPRSSTNRWARTSLISSTDTVWKRQNASSRILQIGLYDPRDSRGGRIQLEIGIQCHIQAVRRPDPLGIPPESPQKLLCSLPPPDGQACGPIGTDPFTRPSLSSGTTSPSQCAIFRTHNPGGARCYALFRRSVVRRTSRRRGDPGGKCQRDRA